MRKTKNRVKLRSIVKNEEYFRLDKRQQKVECKLCDKKFKFKYKCKMNEIKGQNYI